MSESKKAQILVRIYSGGEASPQLTPFVSASPIIGRLLSITVKQEFIFVSDIREKAWKPMDLVNWLRESDFHFILTHPHQGNPRWDCTEVYEALNDLKQHPGFPHNESFHCPVFTQHKFQYLCSISEIVNPTIAVPFREVLREYDHKGNIRYASYSSMESFADPDLQSFMNRHNEGLGWVVKFPFVTVHEGLKFCRTEFDVLKALDVAVGKFGGRIPYAMVQPCLANRKEYKVVVLNGKVSHMLPQDAGVRLGGKNVKSFSTYPHTQLFRFAELAVEMLSKRCKGSHTRGIMRVDVMQTLNGNMIVNEFESLEALYMSTYPSQTSATEYFLRDYWAQTIFDGLKA
jgi:hypothetical protein